MYNSPFSIRPWVLWIVTLPLTATCGCGHELKWRVVGPLDAQAPSVGALRLEATPVDTAALEKGHPFCWRGSETAGFMLFDVKITNTSDQSLLCQVGHLDFPGVVSPSGTFGNLVNSALTAAPSSAGGDLLGPDDLRLIALAHEKATILTQEGYRFEILSYSEFGERYAYLMQKEMQRASVLAYIPYIGMFIAMAQMRDATNQRAERLMEAQQRVMRPGVVPAGCTVRGYLVFAWPQGAEPGSLTLRLPIQPGHAASIQFDLARRGQ